MTNYVANNTDRIRLGYTWGGEKHKVLFRFKDGVLATSFLALIRTALDSNKASFTSSTSFDSAEVANKGFDTFNPMAFVPVVGTASAYPNDANSNASRGCEILARSVGGSLCSWTFYGQPWPTNKAKRFVIPAAANINAMNDVIAQLISASGSPLCAVDGLTLVQRPYVNIIENDFLTRKYRQ